MNQYAGTLFVCVCLGAVTAIAAGCGSSDDSAPVTNSQAGSSTSSGGDTSPGTGGSTGIAGTSTGTGGTTAGGTTIALPSDMTGYVEVDTLGIKGAWYSYGDGIGSDGTTATGDCEKAGHMVSECSAIASPMFGSFPNMNSSMCTMGTVAKVINLMGMMGCPTTSTACDYSAIFGAGIGMDLNNAGGDGGGKLPFNATTAGVIGIAFDIDMLPLAGLRVEFPTPSTTDTAAIWKPASAAKNYVSPVMVGHNVIMFSDVTQPDYVKPAGPLDPTQILSVQFHVPTTTSGSATYNFCISNFSAVTM